MADQKEPSVASNIVRQLVVPSWYQTAAQSAARAEVRTRNKVCHIQYRSAWGAGIRAHLKWSLRQRIAVQSAFFVILYIGLSSSFGLMFGCSAGRHLQSDITIAVLLFVLWLVSCSCTFLLPDDLLYLDRLSFIVPGSHPLDLRPKALWSKVEEVALVDLAKPGGKSKFALRLTEVSGEEHDLKLSLLNRDELPTLVSYLSEFASHARGLAQLKEIERFYDYQSGALDTVSYTQLWESCAAQFSLTSFTPLSPGTRILDTFSVVKQIAAGGFSAIYLIEDDQGNKFVLKESVLPVSLAPALKEKATEQFQREATILAKLDHPQIAKVFDHFVQDGRNYLRIEYIDGPNLRKHISDHHAQPEGVTVSWASQMSSLLCYLHKLTPPVVHRDFSPDNIVVRKDGKLVLIDFGAANEYIGAATGTLVGKHAYMAPEQIRGNAEPASDVYSLGACTFFCLAGRDPEPISTSSPIRSGVKVSEWLDQFVRKCTSLDKAERFQSADECLSYLAVTK